MECTPVMIIHELTVSTQMEVSDVSANQATLEMENFAR